MFTGERREHKRFIVPGKAITRMPDGSTTVLEVLDVSLGGLFLLCAAPPPMGAQVEMKFTIADYEPELSAVAGVVRLQDGAMGVAFEPAPEGIDRLINWLETEWMIEMLK